MISNMSRLLVFLRRILSISLLRISRNLWKWLPNMNPSVGQWPWREWKKVNSYFQSVPLQFWFASLDPWPDYGNCCWTLERSKTGNIVGAGGTVAWDMLQNQITMGKPVVGGSESPFRPKPILPPPDQLRSLLILPNSLSSSRARIRSSSGS